MRQHWNRTTMLEACDLITCGVAARPKYVEEGIPFLSAKNVKEGQIIYEGYNCITKENHEELTKKNKPLIGDILYTRVGSYGEAAVIEEDIEFSVFVSLTLIKPKKKLLNSYFLKYYLNSNEVKTLAKNSITSSGVGNLNVGTVRKFPVPIPPLPEQQRIVSILDQAFAAIEKAKANAEQNLQNAAALFESYLQGVFEKKGDGWEECNLEDNIKLIDYRGRTPQKTESGVRLITAKNVKLGFLQLEPQEYIAEDNYENWMTRGIPNVGDVIFTTEAPLANVAQIESDEKLAFAQRIIVMQPNRKKLNPKFLKYMLLSGPIRKRVLEKGTGATVVGIKSSLLKKISIFFPNTIAEQESIVCQLDALRAETKKLEAVFQKKMDDLEELKKSILQKAFAGDLPERQTGLETEKAVAI